MFNRGAAAVSLQGWRFADGVDFVFPQISIPAGGYLVVAADLQVFRAKYPGVANVIGNWSGTLSNSREKIDLEDAGGHRIDSVRYADEGDWAIRQSGLNDRGHRGWVWNSEHDGLGKSLELINPNLSNNNGQNWASSSLREGTPGRANSIFASNIAPLIENLAHLPLIPKSAEPVVVSASIHDEADLNPVVELNYRLDSLSPSEFTTITMHDDGQSGDAFAGDGIFSATIPPQSNNSVVEFYITAGDSGGLTRRLPAPAIQAADGQGPSGQVANALYQVDDAPYEGTQPLYKIIMTEAERAELASIDNNVGGAANSDAQMNATFISVDGTGSQLRYLAGVRNRGHGTRTAKPNNYRINFRSDEEWKGVTALNLNAQYTWLQVLGAAVNLQSGIPGADSRAVQLRVNNQNVAFIGGIDRTYGSYAANEAIDSDWADHHFPNDGEGNIYRAIRDLAPSDLDYRTSTAFPGLYGAENKDSYTNTWFKSSNVSEDDWTDLIEMLRVFGLNGTVPFTPENLGKVINIQQWLRHLAVMNLLGNSETGLNSGYNDDYFMYRGLDDPRFILMYYDLDQILGYNGSFGANSSLFSATSVSGNQAAGAPLSRFLHHPELEPIYYAQLKNLIETSFSAAQFDSLVDQILGDFVPESSRLQLKSWMAARRAFVLTQLPVNLGAPVAAISGVPRSPTPLGSALLQISGKDVTHYRYRLNSGTFGPETPVDVAISLSGLVNGSNTVEVIARNAAGAYQAQATP
ncbi:MAG TPA: CotH kinase family protein, partial [Verrucomicrobiae bacterium]|nr:CotH kinase family protein [Verrucomicrobiae bacterium]